ncbi:Hypothetical protein, putative [Bodo saltans]|uniref:Uncharacterized protein n=1 Tax=Bodo saltans TaxID=75058 RepID=A0A0S4JLM0_BODSA|nr:Hypothetical protein, putative [Bodo saltans]|eukprot:CUG91290.1 Hypothetical protein, putative [Bodo saltans]
MKLSSGGTDLLDICNGKSPVADLIRSFLVSMGDQVVHFSGEVQERSLSDLVPRWFVLTNKSIVCIPRSGLETGIFFDCRQSLDAVSQIVVDDDSPTANILTQPIIGSDSMHAKSVLFASNEIRKMFLLSLCVAKPSLPILQRRKVEDYHQSATHAAVPGTPQAHHNHGTAAQSQQRGQSGLRRSLEQSATPGHHHSRHSLHDVSSPVPKAPSVSVLAFDIADDVYSASRERLREILTDTWGDATYDSERASSRPAEEDPARAAEREKIKADLDHRERKIIQNIEFKLKYPTKPATKVQPGVEYDKAHEERLMLPDDLVDDELLGPSLYSLWREWKRTNGLVGHAGGAALSEWNLYSSNELIAALEEKEDELFGFVGQRSIRKIRNMRELVSRERKMYLNANKQTSHSPPRQKSMSFITVPKPFSLSESPFATLKSQVRLIEKHDLMAHMKEKHEQHLKSRHELHKQHLNRQLHRLSPER